MFSFLRELHRNKFTVLIMCNKVYDNKIVILLNKALDNRSEARLGGSCYVPSINFSVLWN